MAGLAANTSMRMRTVSCSTALELAALICVIAVVTGAENANRCPSQANVRWLNLSKIAVSGCNHTVQSASLCCSRCRSQPSCFSWTYRHATAPSCPGACYLWTSLPKANEFDVDTESVSGVVTGVVQIPPLEQGDVTAMNETAASLTEDDYADDEDASIAFEDVDESNATGAIADDISEFLEDIDEFEDLDELRKNKPVPVSNTTSLTMLRRRRWRRASLTWYGPGDQVGSTDPITGPQGIGSGWGSCLWNHRNRLDNALLAKYARRYAAVNDHGSEFGMNYCLPNPNSPEYPICSPQQNCGRCYLLRCRQACLRDPTCNSYCKSSEVTVYMVDACPSQSPLQRQLEQQHGFNGCIAAAQTGGNHFDVSKEALETIVGGGSGEVSIWFTRVPC